MKAVRCSSGRIEVQDVPAPRGEGVRVRVASAGICGSDLHLIAAPVPLPHTLGHELAGTLDDGTPVAIEPIAPCGSCDSCERGAYNLCRSGTGIIMGIGRDGGMSEEILVPERCLVPLARNVAVRDACLVEPLAVALHGLRLVGVGPSTRVAVVGGGTIGLCAVAAARGLGADTHLEARHDAQRAAGARLGAVFSEGEFDVVIDAAGTPSALEKAIAIGRPGATLLLLATYWDGFSPPAFPLCLKEIRIVPSSLYDRSETERDVDAAARLLGEQPEIARTLITHRFPLEGAGEAFSVAADRSQGAIKVVLEPGGDGDVR